MTDQTVAEIHPTDLDGQAERDEETHRRKIAVGLQAREDIVWLFSGRRGRRKARRQLIEAGFHPGRDVVIGLFDRHHGKMCFDVGQRDAAMQMLWPIMRLLASGDRQFFESFQKMMRETDHE